MRCFLLVLAVVAATAVAQDGDLTQEDYERISLLAEARKKAIEPVYKMHFVTVRNIFFLLRQRLQCMYYVL